MSIRGADGSEIATLRAKLFSPIKARMTLTRTDGADWHIEGQFVEKDYSIVSDGQPIIHITQKWVTVRDSYTVDIVDGTDVGVALAVLWAIDRWVERD